MANFDCIRGCSIFLTLVGTLFMLVALATSLWTITQFEIDGRKDPYVSRGLFELSLFDGYARRLSVTYDMEDIDGIDADPFCEDASAVSIFGPGIDRGSDGQFVAANLPGALDLMFSGSMFPAVNGSLFIDGSNDKYPITSALNQDLVHFNPTRDNDRNDWCSVRKATIGTGVVSVVCAVLASLVAICVAQRNKSASTAYIVFLTLAVIFGLVATAVFAEWFEDFHDEPRAFEDYVIGPNLEPIESSVWLGPSFALFVVAWVIFFVALLCECGDRCSGGYGDSANLNSKGSAVV